MRRSSPGSSPDEIFAFLKRVLAEGIGSIPSAFLDLPVQSPSKKAGNEHQDTLVPAIPSSLKVHNQVPVYITMLSPIKLTHNSSLSQATMTVEDVR